MPGITAVETLASAWTLVEKTQAKKGETAGLLATAGTEGTPFNSRNAGCKYQQQQGCQQQFSDASNSRADCKSFENRNRKDTCTKKGHFRATSSRQQFKWRKHNRNASNSRDASNSKREATEKTSATFKF
jgi:hypothetical protein